MLINAHVHRLMSIELINLLAILGHCDRLRNATAGVEGIRVTEITINIRIIETVIVIITLPIDS